MRAEPVEMDFKTLADVFLFKCKKAVHKHLNSAVSCSWLARCVAHGQIPLNILRALLGVFSGVLSSRRHHYYIFRMLCVLELSGMLHVYCLGFTDRLCSVAQRFE